MAIKQEMKKNDTEPFSMTQEELARTLGLSFGTVNRVMNGKGRVSEATHRRVMEAASRLGYQKNLIAHSLVKRRTNVIGMVLCGTQNSFFGQVAFGVQARARELKYHVLLADSEGEVANQADALESFLDVRVCGALIQPAEILGSLDLFYRFHRNHVPVVVINNREEAISRNFIGTDGETGAREAVNYLISLGHRRIAHITGDLRDCTGQDRLRGYELAMSMAGLKVEPDWVFRYQNYNADNALDAVDRLLKIHPRPTAVFTPTDHHAMLLINRLMFMGLKIPRDISVMGYSNMPECRFCPVPLTTVDQHPFQMGVRAVETLIELIEEKKQGPYSEILKDTLVVRESCAPPSENE